MTVGMTTFHSGFSYGAVLQATSLNAFLRELGHDAKILERGPYCHDWIFHPWNSLSNAGKNLLVMRTLGQQINRRNRTRDFIARHQVCTNPYPNTESLIAQWPKMEAYVTGSDQVWNLDYRFNPTFFLLPADPARSRLIAYAASFGTGSIPDKWKEKVAEALRRFHALSVREKSAQQIVESLIGERPRLVCDPVFLHNADYYREWELPVTRNFPKQYILVHSVGMDANLDRLVGWVKARLDLPVVHLQGGTGLHSPHGTDLQVFSAGPAEYLHLVDQAACICTNSFHGTAFSLLFRKPFMASAALAGRNTRIENLLNLFGENDRMAGASNQETLLHQCDSVRWAEIQERIQAEGREFLIQALDGSISGR